MFWRWRSTVLMLMTSSVGDLLRGVRLGDQLQHLELARREHVEVLVVGAAALDVVAHERGDRGRVQERLAAHRPPAGVDDVLVGVGLEHVAGGAGLSDSNRNCSLSYIESMSSWSSGLRLWSSAAAWIPVSFGMRDVEDGEVDVLGERPS